MVMATKQDALAARRPAMVRLKQILHQDVGVGVVPNAKGWALKINLNSAPPDDVDLPGTINGVPTKFEVVGPVKLL